MLDNCYHVKSSPDLLTYEFESVGPKGIITKVVHYREINVRGIYNLGFGDKDSHTGKELKGFKPTFCPLSHDFYNLRARKELVSYVINK